MKQQILVIHGGNAFDSYEEFLDSLKTKEVSLERIRAKGWKDNLGEVLGSDYDVLTPMMPNGANAKYLEWQIWFDRLIPLLEEKVILVGHSLGGMFLAKYLSENIFPKKILATLLVAAPYNTKTKHPLADFIITNNLAKFSEQGGEIILYHSRDDKVVPFSNLKSYQKDLPTAEVRIFEDKGHFNQESFPEIVKDIKSL